LYRNGWGLFQAVFCEVCGVETYRLTCSYHVHGRLAGIGKSMLAQRLPTILPLAPFGKFGADADLQRHGPAAGGGALADPRHACKCSPLQIERYMGRISGPLLDRIDLHIEVPAVPFKELSASTDVTSSGVMRDQVGRPRKVN
jgi:hypothetical protein